jgi:hypothetical protein
MDGRAGEAHFLLRALCHLGQRARTPGTYRSLAGKVTAARIQRAQTGAQDWYKEQNFSGAYEHVR